MILSLTNFLLQPDTVKHIEIPNEPISYFFFKKILRRLTKCVITNVKKFWFFKVIFYISYFTRKNI